MKTCGNRTVYVCRKKYTEDTSTCHRITKSSLNRKTGYNASLNLQNQYKLGPSAVLTPVLSDVAADSAWDPRGPHTQDDHIIMSFLSSLLVFSSSRPPGGAMWDREASDGRCGGAATRRRRAGSRRAVGGGERAVHGRRATEEERQKAERTPDCAAACLSLLPAFLSGSRCRCCCRWRSSYGW